MKVTSRAPLRLGLGGGGTDLGAYSGLFGGCVVNVTIGLYAHCTIRESTALSFSTLDFPDPAFTQLHKAVYSRVVTDWNQGQELRVAVTTNCDVPPGSGLGASSAMVVAQLAAYARWLGRSIEPEELARMAYSIERIDLNMSGGYQDQWAAAFGGINFLEFHPGGQVSVTPMRISRALRESLQDHLLLCNTGYPRSSMELIRKQVENVEAGDPHTLDSLHSLKADALFVREILQKGDLVSFASSLRRAWEAKKRLASGISNPHLDFIYSTAIKAGALAGKLAGAGGGGFMLFLVPPKKKSAIIAALGLHSLACGSVKISDSGAVAHRESEAALFQSTLSP